jgi:hypothetical protein
VRGGGAVAQRISLERIALERLESHLDLGGIALGRGMGLANRFQIPSWELPVLQHFQFGDLRIEGEHATVVIELESAGGLTNLVKYWPLLAEGRHTKRFVLAHIFRITSDGDYAAHRRLWLYVVERMREDLQARGVTWPDRWEAAIFTYRRPEDVDGAVPFIKEALS